jgi:sarcosine oxidase subunit beta
MSLPKVADLVVVGGGVNGTSIAFNLAERGLKRVVLLERETLAGGPTGRSSAILRQHYSHEVTARMAFQSLGEFQEFAERVGGECGYVKTGFLMIVDARDADGLKKNISMQQRIGIKTTLIKAQEVKAIDAHLYTEDFLCAAFEPEAGHADPVLTTSAYGEAAKRLGVQIFQKTAVKVIKAGSSRVLGIETDQGTLETRAVIAVAGPWTPALVAPLGVSLPIHACRAQICVVERPSQMKEAVHPIYADFVNSIYIRPEEGRQTLVGSIDPKEAEDRVPNPDNYKEAVDTHFRDEMLEKLEKRVPILKNGLYKGGWVSLYDITPDWHPVIDQVGPEGLFLVAGFSGHGFKLAPATGDMVADLVIKGKSAVPDVQFFSYDRFAKRQLIKGQYEYSIAG